MLVKWAIEGRRKSANTKPSLIDKDRHAAPSSGPLVSNLGAKDGNQALIGPEKTARAALTAQLDRLHYESDTAFAKSSEDEGDRAMRRIKAEERDTALRDDKLLSLTGSQLDRHGRSQREESEPSMPLTEENIGKLAHEQDGDTSLPHESSDDDNDDDGLVDASSKTVKHSRNIVEGKNTQHSVRPSARLRDSEQTIIGRLTN